MVGTLLAVAVVPAALWQRRLAVASRAAFDFGAEVARLKASGELAEPDVHGAEEPLVPREIAREDVTLITELGSGNFGDVWKAVLDESRRRGVGRLGRCCWQTTRRR